ncbi:MAG: thioesterase family protein, partial [Leptotrichiaceae bacterium]|nr:thioesterase family protein [Leptotrichiaceae bacterium]
MKKSFNVRTYYYDTDHMGVVYHANYLKWMEIARTEYFRDILPYKEIEDMGIMMPVKSLSIEYINSVGYDEDV